MPHLVAKDVAFAGWQDFQKTGKSCKSAHIVLVFNLPGLLPERVGIQGSQMFEQCPVVNLTLTLQVLAGIS